MDAATRKRLVTTLRKGTPIMAGVKISFADAEDVWESRQGRTAEPADPAIVAAVVKAYESGKVGVVTLDNEDDGNAFHKMLSKAGKEANLTVRVQKDTQENGKVVVRFHPRERIVKPGAGRRKANPTVEVEA